MAQLTQHQPAQQRPPLGEPARESSRPSTTGGAEHDDTGLVWTRVRTGPARLIIDEWDRLAHRPSVLRRVNSWEFLPRPVEDLDDLLVVCGFNRPVDDSDADRVLWHVVRLAATDDLAARVALHRIMPALVSIARRRGRIVSGGLQAAMAETISCGWMVIRTYPWQRRLNKVAANLVRDTEYHAFVRPNRLRRVEETTVPDTTLGLLAGGTGPDEPELGLDDVLCEAEQLGVAAEHIALLRDLASGRSGAEIAEGWGVSARTVRNHRRAAIDAVRAALQRDDVG